MSMLPLDPLMHICPHCGCCNYCRCSDDAETASSEELETAATIVDRVQSGRCQNCGKKEGCACKFITEIVREKRT